MGAHGPCTDAPLMRAIVFSAIPVPDRVILSPHRAPGYDHTQLNSIAAILSQPYEIFVIFLWLLGSGRCVAGGGAENARIILPPTAVALEFLGIAA